MKTLAASIRIFLVLTLLTGIIYPFAVTAIAAVAFPSQAAGSPIIAGGRVLGSSLVGQEFSDPKYFWGRRSATSGWPYNPATSGGSTLGPTNPALIGGAGQDKAQTTGEIPLRIKALRKSGTDQSLPVPTNLATSSGSGLDPHISPEAAEYQIPRVAAARGLNEDALRSLIKSQLEERTLLVLGEPRINVLKLNIQLDALAGRG